MSYPDSDQALENYKNIFKNNLKATILTHPNKTFKDAIFYANSAAQELFGYSEQEIYNVSWDGIVDNFDQELPIFLKELSSVGKAKAELTFIKKDGSKFKGEIFSNIIDCTDKLTNLSIVNDITERKKAEEALKRSETAMDAFFESSPGILNLEDENFCYINTDPTTPTYFGLKRDTIKGKCVRELVP